MPVIIHQITALLDIPEDYIDLGKYASDIIAASKANTYVAVPPFNITAAGTALTVFSNADTSAERDAAVHPLRRALQAIMFYFQLAANADPTNAEVIVKSGGFRVKKIALNQKHVFVLSYGIKPGTINLDAEDAGQDACHDWMYSADGTTFTHLPPTISAHTHIDGLTPGQYAYFTHEIINQDGGQGVSQIESILVK